MKEAGTEYRRNEQQLFKQDLMFNFAIKAKQWICYLKHGYVS